MCGTLLEEPIYKRGRRAKTTPVGEERSHIFITNLKLKSLVFIQNKVVNRKLFSDC